MTSQTDVDQGGTTRAWTRAYLGPSVGYVNVPQQNTLAITAAGTYNVDLSTSLITVNVSVGAVTINLPAATNPSYAGAAVTQSGKFADNPIMLVDIGGFAASNPITVVAAAGENIIGVASIQISNNFGSYALLPISTQHGWNLMIAGTSLITGPGSSTVNDLALWANTVGSQLKDGAGLTVSGNYSWSGTQANTNTTDSTSTSTGSIVLSGGLGVAKQVQLGGALTGVTSKFQGTNVNTAGPPYPLQVQGDVNSTIFNPFVLNATIATFYGGDFGSSHPLTTVNPMVSISRTESINNQATGGGQNAALFVTSQGANTATLANNPATTAITAYGYQQAAGSGDAQGIVVHSSQNGGGVTGVYGYAAIGGFFNATANSATSACVSIQTQAINNTGAAMTWNNWVNQVHGVGTPSGFGVDIEGDSGGVRQLAAAINIRNQWDVGIGFDYASAPGPFVPGTFFIKAVSWNVDLNGSGNFQTLGTSVPTSQSGATYTVAPTDSSIVAAAAGTQTLTLPTPASFPGRWLHIKTVNAQAVVSASSNVVALAGGSPGTAILAATAGKWAFMQSDGTNWVIMGGN